MKRAIGLLVVLVLSSLLLIAGCGNKDAANSQGAVPTPSPITGAVVADIPSEATEELVYMRNIDLLGKEGYSVYELNLRVGDSVTWTNKDPARKKIVVTFGFEDRKEYWNSPLILPDESYSFTFTKPGEYVFWNLAYAGKGKIIVEE